MIPIWSGGCFSTIKTKAKVSLRLGASGETPQMKTFIDISRDVIFPSRLLWS